MISCGLPHHPHQVCYDMARNHCSSGPGSTGVQFPDSSRYGPGWGSQAVPPRMNAAMCASVCARSENLSFPHCLSTHLHQKRPDPLLSSRGCATSLAIIAPSAANKHVLLYQHSRVFFTRVGYTRTAPAMHSTLAPVPSSKVGTRQVEFHV